jgi:hypothetical protein
VRLQRHRFVLRRRIITRYFEETPVRSRIRAFALLTAVAAAGIVGACANPEIEAKQWDEIQILSQTVSELRTYANDLELMIDSINKIMLRQDTALRLIVDFTGAQVPAYKTPGTQ